MAYPDIWQDANGKRCTSPEYRAWQAVKNRCLNPRGQDWKYYGGRGITFEPRWVDFAAFLKDMGRKPRPELTLERINGNKAYCKANCTWATRQVQARNRAYVKLSLTKVAQIRQASGYQKDIARRFGVSQGHISQLRLGRGWGVEHG
jgi:hypothetical protein